MYLKSTLTGDEPVDVLQYHAQHPEFPHTPTADQFFDESKFESYRALGYHILTTVLCKSVRELGSENGNEPLAPEALFKRIRQDWFPPPSDLHAANDVLPQGYMDLHMALRTDERLHELATQLYGGVELKVKQADSTAVAQLQFLRQMLHVLEEVWMRLQLDVFRDYPPYAIWLERLRRWTSAPLFRQHWPVLKGECREGFARFCQTLIDGDEQGRPVT